MVSVYLNVAKILCTWAGKGNIYEKEKGYDSFALYIGKVFIGNDTEDSVVVRSRNLPLEVILYRRHR